MKNVIGIAIGIVIGAVGAVLFVQSTAPEDDTYEKKVLVLQRELKEVQLHNNALKSEGYTGKPKRTMKDGMRSIAQEIRAGNTVDLDDVFRAAQPWMQDMSPIFDRIRLRDQKEHFDTLASELTREYSLTESQQQRLTKFLHSMAEKNAEAFSKVVDNEQSTMEDLIRATRDVQSERDIESFMETMLTGDDLERYQYDRLTERVESVQKEADRKLTRLDRIVTLDEDQKDQAFGMIARSTDDYDPSMQFEGIGEDTSTLVTGESREEALLSILRPDQQQTFRQHQRRQRREAQQKLEDVGLSLPDGWDQFDEGDF